MEANEKLKTELDVLGLLKELRISRFLSQIELQPHQLMLIKFFDEYTLRDQRPSTADIAQS